MRAAITRLTLLVLLLVAASTQHAFADDRGEARTHYMAGVKAYNGADYRAAIKEFSAAQQLAPADLNNYNLALCYDKLGDAENAITYYRNYLDKVPASDKRGEIEASVARLDAAVKSSQAKKVAEEKAAADAKAAEEAKKAEAMKKAEADARAAEEARKAEEMRKLDEGKKKLGPAEEAPPPVNGGSTGRPGDGVVTRTGDPALDRAQSIDINAIRDQRVNGQSSGMIDVRGSAADGSAAGGQRGVIEKRGGPATQAPSGNAPPPVNGQQQFGQQGPAQGGPPVASTTQPNNQIQSGPVPPEQKHADPLYKKWWFWAIVAVSAYVVYEIATSDPSNTSTARTTTSAQRPTGLTLFSW